MICPYQVDAGPGIEPRFEAYETSELPLLYPAIFSATLFISLYAVCHGELYWSPVWDLNSHYSCSQSKCHNQIRRTGD